MVHSIVTSLVFCVY